MRGYQILGMGILAAAITGCGGSDFEIVPVSGIVTLDGEPVPDAQLTFQPIADPDSEKTEAGSGSYGTTDENGRYTLKTVVPDGPGAVVGRHNVMISTAQMRSQNDDAGWLTKDIIPAHYRDGQATLWIDISGPTDQANFELTSKPPPRR